ncbi:MAG: NAD(P)/FAD-dependent oxidoreductase [Bacteroidales bacterium]|nr:NAD(P)/FAD-dependent oxidoreductase [Bacteroidales bacterium]
MKSIAIIGGGVAGLAAGIFAQRSGFSSEIHEKHAIPGGQCTAWKRKGYTLDNCVHWLTGTDSARDIHTLWEQLGVLGPEVEMIRPEAFFELESNGEKLVFWKDLERLRKELLELSPEDADEIELFINNVRTYEAVDMLALKPKEMLSPLEFLRKLKAMKEVGKIHGIYSKMTIGEYASRFRHPLLRRMITAYMPETYNVASVFFVYGVFCSGNGDLPKGGSPGIIARMTALYESLGGRITTSHEATGIELSGKRIKAVRFSDGSVASADWYVFACDTYETFSKIIGPRFMDRYFRDRYVDKADDYRIYNTFNCYFSVDGKASDVIPSWSVALTPEQPLNVLGTDVDNILLKHFDYEPDYAPEGHSVLQAMFTLYESDYMKWSQLRNADLPGYRMEKEALGQQVMDMITDRYPALKGRLELLDATTPVTYERYCNAYKGAYMSFILTPYTPKVSHKGYIKGLDNAMLSGQWLQSPGGLPNAAATGRFTIQRICRRERIRFKEI